MKKSDCACIRYFKCWFFERIFLIGSEAAILLEFGNDLERIRNWFWKFENNSEISVICRNYEAIMRQLWGNWGNYCPFCPIIAQLLPILPNYCPITARLWKLSAITSWKLFSRLPGVSVVYRSFRSFIGRLSVI